MTASRDSDRPATREELERRLQLETALIDALVDIATTPGDQTDSAITHTLGRVALALGFDVVAILERAADSSFARTTHLWARTPRTHGRMTFPLMDYPMLNRAFDDRAGASWIRGVPSDPTVLGSFEYDFLASQGFTWARVVPLALPENGSAVFACAATGTDSVQEELFEVRAEAISRVLGGAFARRLRARENRRKAVHMRRLLDALPDAALLLDSNGTILCANAATAHRMNQPVGQVRGLNLLDESRPGSDHERRRETVETVMNARRPVRFTDEVDGRTRENRVYPILGSDGSVSKTAVFSRDTTEQPRTSGEHHHNERRLAAVFASAPDTLAMLGPDHTIELINRTDWFPEGRAVVGARMDQVLCPNNPGQIRALLEQAIAQGAPVHRDLTLTLHGANRRISLVIAPVVAKDETIGTVLAARDITRRLLLEVEAAALHKSFRQVQRLEAIGRLAGGVAHDFNNYLTVINTYADLVADELADHDPIKKDALEILSAGRRAAQMTRQLLAFSSRQPSEPRVLSLNSVIGDLEKMLQRLIGEDIVLEVRLGSRLGAVQIDPGQLEQVLMNLAVNSRDAMQGGGRLGIETANVTVGPDHEAVPLGASPGPYVHLRVHDTGTGIPEKIQEHVFEPFYTTKEAGKGTGLGLSTVYGIVRQAGGVVTVKSKPGEGATFDILLPRCDEASSADPDTTRIAPQRGHETILVVEDEPAVKLLVRRILERAGYRVIIADHPWEALRIGRTLSEPIHLVLSDVVMPDMSGAQLVQELSQMRPNLRVLLMSGYSGERLRQHMEIDNSGPVLRKPFEASTLLQLVRERLDEKQ